MKHILEVFKVVRPIDWLKNTFVLAPLFFAGCATDFSKLTIAIGGAICFSLIASSVYCFNDLMDIEADRLHPQKRKRPIASGILSKRFAIGLMVLLAVAGFTVSFILQLSENAFLFLVAYYLLNLLYSACLKKYAIIDVMIIAVGFVLRLFVGSEATQIHLSHWIVLMTFLLALFMAFAKRRDDVLIYDKTGVLSRDNVIRYNLVFLNTILSLLSAVTIVCYIQYTVSEEVIAQFDTPNLYLTSVFVIAGILRYLQLTQVDQKSSSPTQILYKDRFIQVTILLWLLTFAYIIYQ